MTVRVRYGPSPTGEPHVGNIRTALFDWLFARHHGGQFLVRIEDTDQRRTVEGAEERIFDALRWLGIDWDEGPDIGGPYAPYRQSQRLPLYDEAVEKLLADGAAYRCACTPERLDALRKAQQSRKQPPGYDGHCRSRPLAEVEREIAEHEGRFVVRLRIPEDGVTEVVDALRGAVSFDNALLDDHVLCKADGYPTYHLASVVDDAAMAITHVFRGDEWLSSAPRHLLLYRALALEPPVFVHLPVILGPDKGKLSKRHGAVSVREYAAQGFLPEAMMNFLALLGWAKDDRTVQMSVDEIIAAFDIDGLGTTSATFDLERLTSMNGAYIRDLSADAFLARVGPWLEERLPAAVPRPVDVGILRPVAPLIQERVKLLSEVVDYTDFFFLEGPLPYAGDSLLGKGFRNDRSGALAALTEVRSVLAGVEPWTAERIEAALRGLADRLELKPGVLFTPVRVAVTGRTVAPPLFETIALLGKERTLARLQDAAERLEQVAG